VDDWQIDPQPPCWPIQALSRRNVGIEDPRITYLPELGRYAVVYTAYTREGPGVALALTEDFRRFERYGVIMPPKTKMRLCCLIVLAEMGFGPSPGSSPERIFGCPIRPICAIGRHKLMLESRRGGWWDANKIGLSPPSSRPKRLLMIYHGVRQTRPARCTGWGSPSLTSTHRSVASSAVMSGFFGPEAPYEQRGTLATSCSPAASPLPRRRHDHLYYGAADSSIASRPQCSRSP